MQVNRETVWLSRWVIEMLLVICKSSRYLILYLLYYANARSPSYPSPNPNARDASIGVGVQNSSFFSPQHLILADFNTR